MDASFEAFVKKAEENGAKLDAVMRDGNTPMASKGYFVGAYLMGLMNDCQKARAT
jgi:hypothetical protein